MAKKKQAVDILPPPSSCDDDIEDEDGSTDDDEAQPQPQQPQNPQNQEEESDDETEESDDDSDDEPEPHPVVNKPSLQHPQNPQNQEEESDDENDRIPKQSEQSDDATQNSPSASAFTIKPRVSKSPQQKTPTSKAVSKNQQPGNGNGKVKGKRPAEIEKVSKSKKSKLSNGSAGNVEKGSNSNKIVDEGAEKKSIIKWSDKDEDALLGGIIKFKAETGEDVNPKLDAFYDYVKDLLSIHFTKTQLYEKIRRLKKKFHTNADKWQNAEEPVFSKPHDNKLFELSHKIWAVTQGADTKKKEPLKQASIVQQEVRDTIMEEDNKEETNDFPLLCASLESEASAYLTLKVGDIKDYVKKIISDIGQDKARELEDQWKALHVLDYELHAKKADMILKQAGAVSHSLKNS